MENLYVKLAAYREMETERLRLRPVTLEDAPAMFEYASDETVTRYTFATNQSLEETRIILPSLPSEPTWKMGDQAQRKWKIYRDD